MKPSAYARQAGLDPETVLESIGKGAAASWSLNNLGPKMIQGDDAPGFFIRHFVKDMGIARSAAKNMEMKPRAWIWPMPFINRWRNKVTD